MGYIRVAAFIALLAAPLAAEAQAAGKIPRIGILGLGSAADAARQEAPFRLGLREHGYVEGRNVTIDWRVAEGQMDRLDGLAAELVGLAPDVLVCAGNPGVAALKRATRSIPIVMAGAGNPIGRGFVASLARPGGNITGLTSMSQELDPKRLELLKETVPSLSRVAYLWEAGFGLYKDDRLEAAARQLGIEVKPIPVSGPGDLGAAFETAVRVGAGAIWEGNGPLSFTHRERIAQLALTHRLPWIGALRTYPEAGGLMSYGTDWNDLVRRSASYVDRILKGADPATMPVQQAEKFELVINLKTAKAIGLTVPPSMLARANEVIQ